MAPSATQDGHHAAANPQATTTNKSMKAVRFHGKEDLRLDDIPEPTCSKGLIKIKPAWTGICGSDLHEYLGKCSAQEWLDRWKAALP